jgi:hypothetical protein
LKRDFRRISTGQARMFFWRAPTVSCPHSPNRSRRGPNSRWPN